MLIAYHGNESEKTAILAQLARHRAADQLVQGQYWEDGKGCAVACTIYSDNHMEYEKRFGIPVMLARLEDCIFEGLPNAGAMKWPERFMGAIEPGADLSRVGWQFLYWLLTEELGRRDVADEAVVRVIAECAAVIEPATRGEPIDREAAYAVDAAVYAAAARADTAAAYYTVYAAWVATAASADAARAAADAALAAADADAALAAADAPLAAAAVYERAAVKLIELIEAAPEAKEK